MVRRCVVLACILGFLIGGSAVGAPVMLSNVPAYNWYHGCGPTAAASVIGYYDLRGYDSLFTASGWAAVSQTINVQDQISSPAHNAKYDPTPDDAGLPVPPNTSLACWFQTSKDPLGFGGSYQSLADDCLRGYTNYRGYSCSSSYEQYILGILGFTWSDLKREINASRPMMFLVDSDGNGSTDHFVPVLGYDDRGSAGKYYACYTTWSEDETVAWYKFQGMGQPFGVAYGTYLTITSAPGARSASMMEPLAAGGVGPAGGMAPVPEPSTLVLLGMGMAGLIVFWARSRRR